MFTRLVAVAISSANCCRRLAMSVASAPSTSSRWRARRSAVLNSSIDLDSAGDIALQLHCRPVDARRNPSSSVVFMGGQPIGDNGRHRNGRSQVGNSTSADSSRRHTSAAAAGWRCRPTRSDLVCEVFLKPARRNKNSNFSKSRRLSAPHHALARSRREAEPFVVALRAGGTNSATARSTGIWIAVLR